MYINVPIENKSFTVNGISIDGQAATYELDTSTGSCFTYFEFKLGSSQSKRTYIRTTYNGTTKMSSAISTDSFTYVGQNIYFYANSDGTWSASQTFTVLQDKTIGTGQNVIGSFTWSITLPAIDKSAPVVDSESITLIKEDGTYKVSKINFSLSHPYNITAVGKITYVDASTGSVEGGLQFTSRLTSGQELTYDSDDQGDSDTLKSLSYALGTYAKLIIVASADNGTSSVTYEYTQQIPDIPASVTVSSLPDMAVGDTATVTYVLNHHPYASNDFDDSSVTITNSNSNVVSLSDVTITALAVGTSTITVTSKSNTSASGAASVFVSDGSFPVFDDYYYTLDKNLTDKIIYGCEYLQNSIKADDYEVITFNGYRHDVRTIYTLITGIISNIKVLATASSSSADVSITILQKNSNTNWLTAVNKMIDAIQTMQTEQGL